MPYTHFRLIDYEVDTASGTDTSPVIAGWDDKGALDLATSEMSKVLSYARPGFLGAIGWSAGPSDACSTADLGPPIAPQRVPIPSGAQRVPAPYSSIPQQQLAFYPVTAVL